MCVSHHGSQVSQSECQCVCGNANEREWPLSVVSHLVTQTDLIISSYSAGDTRIFPVRAQRTPPTETYSLCACQYAPQPRNYPNWSVLVGDTFTQPPPKTRFRLLIHLNPAPNAELSIIFQNHAFPSKHVCWWKWCSSRRPHSIIVYQCGP